MEPPALHKNMDSLTFVEKLSYDSEFYSVIVSDFCRLMLSTTVHIAENGREACSEHLLPCMNNIKLA